jgi:CBS domain containing-hemolysin-like protein
LEVSDLERAIEVTTPDARLAEQERIVLSNIVAMSDIRVDEWMRPRTQFLSFRPPVSLAHLDGKMTPSGYLLVTEPDGDEITAAIDLQNLVEIPSENLEEFASPVSYVPWCATVADAFQQMRQREHDVVAVVNEFGDTIGILTFEDILDTVFTHHPSRSGRLWNRAPIAQMAEGVWQVIGVTSLRRLARYFETELPPSRSTTLAGVVQETLQRLPAEGDSGRWGPFEFQVIEALDRAHILVELTRVEDDHMEEGG